jgi:hypothetical protein
MLERQIQDQSCSWDDLSLEDGFRREHEDPTPPTPPSVRAAGVDDVDDAMGSMDMNMALCADWFNDGSAWPGLMIAPVHATEQLGEPTPSPGTTLADLELSDLAWADLWAFPLSLLPRSRGRCRRRLF